MRDRLDEDERGQQRYGPQRQRLLPPRRERPVAQDDRADGFQRVRARRQREQGGPAQRCPRRRSGTSTPRADASTGTPGGANGTRTVAMTTPEMAAAGAPDWRSCGAMSARNAAGNIASSPSAAGSPMASPASAPAIVPVFQKTYTLTPVAQKARRARSRRPAAPWPS